MERSHFRIPSPLASVLLTAGIIAACSPGPDEEADTATISTIGDTLFALGKLPDPIPRLFDLEAGTWRSPVAT